MRHITVRPTNWEDSEEDDEDDEDDSDNDE